MSDSVPTPTSSFWSRGLLIAVVLFVVTFVMAHLVRPELDPAWVPVSEYALGELGWPMLLAFLSLAAACSILIVVWQRTLQGWQGVVAQVCLALAAVGFVLAVVFPADSILAMPQQTTTAGIVHSIGAVLVDGIPLASLFAAWAATRSGDRVRSLWLWSAAALAWSGFIAVIVAMAIYLPAAGALGPDAPIGWANRYMMAAYAAWLVCVTLIARQKSS